jgi:hypothetical protein
MTLRMLLDSFGIEYEIDAAKIRDMEKEVILVREDRTYEIDNVKFESETEKFIIEF